jgi:hypothetical protein
MDLTRRANIVTTITLLAVLCAAGCFTNRNRDQGSERQQTFSGYVPAPGTLVRISVLEDSVGGPTTETWDFLGNVRSSTTASFNDCDGTAWYQFVIPLDLPAPNVNLGLTNLRREVYYSSAYAAHKFNTIRFRAQLPELNNMDVTVFEKDDVLAANGQQTSVCLNKQSCLKDAINNCKSQYSPTLTLDVPCGATGSVCCVFENGNGCGPGASQCNDICWDSGAICDGDMVCRSKSDLWPARSAYSDMAFNQPSNNIHRSWTHQMQGVASDGSNWYFTQGEKNGSSEPGRLWKVPFNAALDTDFYQAGYKTTNTTIGTYCWHWGDPEFWKSNIYVPMEQCDDGKIRIARYRASDLSPIDTTVIGTGSASSIAVNPSTGRFLVTADGKIRMFHRDTSVSRFALVDDGGIQTINPNGTVYAFKGALQGIAFSPRGDKLYIANDNDSNNGLLAFAFSPHKLVFQMALGVQTCNSCLTPQELEGLTVVNTDFNGGPNVGQIHLFNYEDAGNPFDGDSGHAWFKHVRVSDSRY